MATKELLSSLSDKTLARLFPVGKDANHERGITSIFLATLSIVNGYASGVMSSIGRKTGVRSSVECHTEVPFAKAEGSDRPDGLIILKNGKKVIWTAIVEAKIGNSSLNEEQTSRYLELAKVHKIDAVITISNQLAVLPTHHPVKISKKLTRNVELLHWSWAFLRTQADYQLRVEEGIDLEQCYILGEMVRYFDHPKSGVQSFDSMNKEWRDVSIKVKNQEQLLKSSKEVQSTISAWHQKQRELALKLTGNLGVPVSIKLSKLHKTDPEKRLKDDVSILCENKSLRCHFVIPSAASLLSVNVSLANRTVTNSMELLAPEDKKTTKAKVNWLVRQLAKVETSGIRICAKWPSRANDTWASLEELRENPAYIQTENTKLVPHRFMVETKLDLAGKFSGQKTFIEGLEKSVIEYYHTIGENLSAWVAPAPKFESHENKQEEVSGSF